MEDVSLASVGEVEQDALNQFTCGDDELDTFLREEAKPYAECGITATTVVFRNGDVVPIGFFSLSTDCLPLSPMEEFELGIPFPLAVSFFPAVKITKLAVRQDEQSGGIGKDLIKFIQGMVFTDHVSVRLLTVNAVNRPRTIAFYDRAGFIRSHKNDQRQQRRGQPEPETVLYYKDLYADE